MSTVKYIHFISQYAAPYKGNFIPSLEILEKALSGYTVIYTFPQQAESQPWMSDFKTKHEVCFTDNKVDSQNAVMQLLSIFVKYPPRLIHTHFDGYDVSVVRAAKSFDCNIIWHMHNYLSFMPNLIKKAYQSLLFFRHFGLTPNKNVYLISVCEEMRKFACNFGFETKRTVTIPNGIDISRFQLPAPRPTQRIPFVFLAFGGRNNQKRIDLICDAVKQMNSDLPFEVRITKGVDTGDVINKGKYNNISKIRLLEQSSNIAQYFSEAHCFISSSVHETFSYAIAEASLCGCAIIQSDISGTAWNREGAATWVFPSENTLALARCMMQVMQDDTDSLEKRCKLASEYIQQNYSLHTWRDKIVQFYKNNKLI